MSMARDQPAILRDFPTDTGPLRANVHGAFAAVGERDVQAENTPCSGRRTVASHRQREMSCRGPPRLAILPYQFRSASSTVTTTLLERQRARWNLRQDEFFRRVSRRPARLCPRANQCRGLTGPFGAKGRDYEPSGYGGATFRTTASMQAREGLPSYYVPKGFVASPVREKSTAGGRHRGEAFGAAGFPRVPCFLYCAGPLGRDPRAGRFFPLLRAALHSGRRGRAYLDDGLRRSASPRALLSCAIAATGHQGRRAA